MRLNASTIPRLAQGRYHDPAIPGLYLRVGVHRRTWYLRYHEGGSYHADRLGCFPTMGLVAARKAARKILTEVDARKKAESLRNPPPPRPKREPLPKSPAIITDDDGQFPVAYTAKRLIVDGYVRNTDDLRRKTREEGFPAPIKSRPGVMQSAVIFHGPSVRLWWKNFIKAAKG